MDNKKQDELNRKVEEAVKQIIPKIKV